MCSNCWCQDGARRQFKAYCICYLSLFLREGDFQFVKSFELPGLLEELVDALEELLWCDRLIDVVLGF